MGMCCKSSVGWFSEPCVVVVVVCQTLKGKHKCAASLLKEHKMHVRSLYGYIHAKHYLNAHRKHPASCYFILLVTTLIQNPWHCSIVKNMDMHSTRPLSCDLTREIYRTRVADLVMKCVQMITDSKTSHALCFQGIKILCSPLRLCI